MSCIVLYMNQCFRIQSAARDATDLLDPANWLSELWAAADDEDVRPGISACWTVADLAAYWQTHGGDLTDVVLVEMRAHLSDTPDHDAADGAILVEPTEIVAVTPLPQEFWDVLFADPDEEDAA